MKPAAITGTKSGQIEGRWEGDLCVFRGVPYAEPPIGTRRWAPPEPVRPWSGVRRAHAFASASCQPDAPPTAVHPIIIRVLQPRSEDCLFLNIWTPGLDDRDRPVLVWIHGGGYQVGAGSQPNYDGQHLARRGDAVVVTINYRLGALGFLKLDDLTGGRIPAGGNNGRLDQIAALTWVRENIRAFGGDPGNVTIFGESAGAIDCAAMMASPRAAGLFKRAIIQSGSAHSWQSAERASRTAELFLECLDIRSGDVDAIRNVSAERLIGAEAELLIPKMAVAGMVGRTHFNPVVDGNLLPEPPIEAIRKGASAGTSLLVGTNLDEMRLGYAASPPPNIGDAELLAALTHYMPEDLARLQIGRYGELRRRRGQAATPFDLLPAIETDRVLRIPAIRLAEAKRDQGRQTHHYVFDWVSPAVDGLLGACHGVEMGFVFGVLDATFNGAGREAQRLSNQVQDAWLSFARSGDPSCASLGEWPAYGDGRETMILGPHPRLALLPLEEERLAWEDFPDERLAVL